MSRITALVDTSVLVDLSRGDTRSQAWSLAQKDNLLGLHVVVSMELAEGARDKDELERVNRMLSRYDLVYLTPPDCVWAVEQHRVFHLSHGVGLLDALIASSAVRLNIPIYTHNLRHFEPLPDVLAVRPY